MSTNLNVNIRISNNYFSINEERDANSESGVETLLKIEEIVSKRMLYAPNINDSYSNFDQDDLYFLLDNLAENIVKKEENKISNSSLFDKFIQLATSIYFGDINSSFDNSPKKIYQRIHQLLFPLKFQLVHPEVDVITFSCLNLNDIKNCERVNKYFYSIGIETEKNIARKYGYIGNDISEAREYLKNLFCSLKALIENDIKKTPQFKINFPICNYPHTNKINLEGTLDSIIKDVEILKGPSMIRNNHKTYISKVNLNSALHTSIAEGNFNKVNCLLVLGADINSIYKHETPLTRAIYLHKRDIAELLITKGASLTATNERMETPLICAAIINDLNLTRVLLANGALITIHHQDENGNTALHQSAMKGNLEITKLFVEAGANLTLQNQYKKTPLQLAASNQKPDICDYLIESEKGLNILFSLQIAAESGNLKTVNHYLNQGFENSRINEVDEYGNTLLHYAIKSGNIDLMRLFLSLDADFTIQNGQGNTAIHWAAFYKRTDILKYFMECQADFTQQNSLMRTPLHIAANNLDYENCRIIMKHLKERSVPFVNIQDNRGNTPFHLALKAGSPESDEHMFLMYDKMIPLFFSYQADPDLDNAEVPAQSCRSILVSKYCYYDTPQN